MKKFFGVIMILLVGVVTQATTGACQRIEANGSLVGSTRGAWVVEKMSGGVITDVYLLDNVMVQSEPGSDGWLFIDHQGNPVHIGGDMKAIRCTNDQISVFNQYVEYHMDIDHCTYAEKFARVKGKSDGPTSELLKQVMMLSKSDW